MMMKRVVAFDVSKERSMMVIYNQNRICEYEGNIEHTQSSFHQLGILLETITVEAGEAPEIVFEATGVYSKPLECFLQREGYAYYRVNPLEAKIQLASMRRQKTDIQDAHGLASSHFRVERVVTHQEEAYYDQMRAISRYVSEIDDEIQSLTGRLHAILQLSFPGIERIFSTQSFLFLNLIQHFPHPHDVLSCSMDVICERLQGNTSKLISKRRIEEKGVALYEAAKEAYPAITQEDIRCEQVRDYAKRLSELKEKKESIIRQSVKLSEDRVMYQVLRSFPGIGELTAIRLIGEIGDIRKFKTPKQLNAYVGIDIRRYQSGGTMYRDIINKRGNHRLRKILYFMIQTMIRHRRHTKNHLVDYYDKLKTQPQRKPHKVASIACINKFLKVAFHLITHEITYHYETARTTS
jgi:transposase